MVQLLVVLLALAATLSAPGSALSPPVPPAKVPILLVSRSEHVSRLRGKSVGNAAKGGPLLNTTVIRRSLEELEISNVAGQQAAASAKTAKTSQQELVAKMAVEGAVKSHLKVKPMLPKARAQLLTVRRYAAEAEIYATHAAEVAYATRHIADNAAQHALTAAKGWIWHDAMKTAEKSGKVDNRIDRLAGAVAAAAEPYHLALLRNQKFCEETYAKAKSAHSSVLKLIDDAKKVALKAQEMQATGLGFEAQETKGMANTMMNQADELRQWSQKLYTQANTACSTSAGYELLEQQAAANTAATTIINAPMKLPSMTDAMRP